MQTTPSSIQIFVKTLLGNTVTLDVNPSDTTIAVKAYLREKTGFPTQTLRLIFGGKQLRDSCTLQQHGIGWGSTLQLFGSLFGGIRLFHCTSESNAASIRRNGFRCGSSGIVGGGIYSAMSAQDAIRKAHANGAVLTCDVDLGRVHDVGFDGDRSLNLSRIRKLGCDSVRIPRNGEPGTEYCVYEPARVRLVGEHGSPDTQSHQVGASADAQAYDGYQAQERADYLANGGNFLQNGCFDFSGDDEQGRTYFCHACNGSYHPAHVYTCPCPPLPAKVLAQMEANRKKGLPRWTGKKGLRF